MKVQELLQQATGSSEAEFVAAHPHHVLVEVEAQSGGGPVDLEGVTERLTSAAIRRQSLASSDADVLELRPGAGGAVTVGRATHCELRIDHASISKEHARFTLDGERMLLEDLGSTNGTQVNGRRIEPHAPVAVRPDDSVVFGKAQGFFLMSTEGFYNYLGLLQRFGF